MKWNTELKKTMDGEVVIRSVIKNKPVSFPGVLGSNKEDD